MAFRAVVVVALVALAHAGMDADYMKMMGGGMMNGGWNQMNGGWGGNQMQMMNGGMQGSGCTGNGCNVPAGIDMGDYLQQQMDQQYAQTQEMANKIKAQFEDVMKQVMMKKARYAMSVMTEFTSMCACFRESLNIYQVMFVETARAANMTDVVEINMDTKPYEAKSAKEARELIFFGMVTSLCTSLGEFMQFAESVEDNINVIEGRVNTTPFPGK